MRYMRRVSRSFIAVACWLAASLPAGSALAAEPIYLDTGHSFEDRAADLVARMTLEEKISQLQNDAAAIPRLNVPAYEWWNEALHGVARAGSATVFPQAIGLAATFDPSLMHEVASAISDEARAKHQEAERRGQHGRYQGLNFWSPNINIFRDPRWGRGQETYGEDPYLTARMGVAFVTGMQGDDIFKQHKIAPSAEAAAAMALRAGLDLDCGHAYAALTGAVRQGLVTEAQIDVSVRRLMLARMQLGMFDPPAQVKWTQTPYSVNQSPANDRLALRAAEASIVLLKNDRLLPLSRDIGTVAVIGPTADDVVALLGNYFGTPSAPVTVLQGIRGAVGKKTKVLYARGADLVEGREEPRAAPAIDSQYLRPSAGSPDHGLKGEYFSGREFSGSPVLTRTDARVSFRWDRGSPTDDLVAQGQLAADKALPDDNFCIRWTGQLLPPTSGRYELAVGADDGFRLFVDGKLLIDNWHLNPRMQSKSAFVDLQAGQAYDIRLEYFEDIRDAEVRLAWQLPGAKSPFDAALDAAKAADVVVFVGGLTGDVEGEEMKVSFPGFAGGDRTDLRLPATQEKLLEAVQATGKPVVLVLTTGSALAIDWAKEHVPAIVVAWYPGQRGGDAVADVLFGGTSPAGRLPATFYKAAENLPPFDDYSMRGRTYRYFEGEPLFPFGYGLSYTQFQYAGLKIDRARVGEDDPVHVSVAVKNVGPRAADEVVQLYVRELVPPGAARSKVTAWNRASGVATG